MPCDAQIPAAISRMAASIWSCTLVLKARTVPFSRAVSGMTLPVWPAWNWVTLITAGSNGFSRRLTMF